MKETRTETWELNGGASGATTLENSLTLLNGNGKRLYYYNTIQDGENCISQNTLFNSKEYIEASAQGYTHKIWVAYPDDRVRPTHVQTNGSKIPIGAYFTVGNARMLYPKDLTSEFSTAGDYPEEYINCRCQIKYV